MSENIEKVLQNEEKVEVIVKKTIKYDSIADGIKNDVRSILCMVGSEDEKRSLLG